MRIKTRHKWLVAIGLLIAVAGWLAWTMSSAESDLAPRGSVLPPPDALTRPA